MTGQSGAVCLMAAFILVLSPPALGAGRVPFASCFAAASKWSGAPQRLLVAIARQESSFNPRAVNRNGNRSEDVGIMQINSSWLPKLSRYGIDRAKLFEPCVNIHVGAWILAHNIRQHGPTWKAVGAYNAVSADKQLRYVQKIHEKLTSRP